MIDSNPNSKTSSKDSIVDSQSFFEKKSIIILTIIIGIGLFTRLYYFPQYQLGFSDDAVIYFWYANDISILGRLPNYVISSGGWSIFLSFFFAVFNFDNFRDYLTLQTLVSISISVITIIPIYLLCNRFFGKSLSLVGALLFSLEPHLIQNSLLGATEPLYIFILSVILFLFLSHSKKVVYTSFGLLGLLSIVRIESVFLLVPFLIIFFLRFRNEGEILKKYSLVIGIFVLMLLPMVAEKTLVGDYNYLEERISSELRYVTGDLIDDPQSIPYYYEFNFKNPVKFLGWSMIPLFLPFVPFGIILIFKNWKKNNSFIILSTIFVLLPGFYALLRFSDTRYIFPAYPLFCVISLFAVKWFSEKFTHKNLFIIFLLCGIILSSALFLDFKVKVDELHENEALSIAKEVIKRTDVINHYAPESKYLFIAKISELENFPVLSSQVEKVPLLDLHANSLENYIILGESKGLTHLVLDGRDSIYRPPFFKDVFNNEQKYPYLIKKYDSADFDYNYIVKIFEIDYEKFNQISKS